MSTAANRALLWEAFDLATTAHTGQKYGEDPYGVHLLEVLDIVRKHTSDPDLHAAALLHDVIEDTSMGRADIAAWCNPRVVALCDAVTDGDGQNRRERKERPYRLIPKTPGALLIKLADRLANMRACLRTGDKRLAMYVKEHEAFDALLYDGDPVLRPLWADVRKIVAEARLEAS